MHQTCRNSNHRTGSSTGRRERARACHPQHSSFRIHICTSDRSNSRSSGYFRHHNQQPGNMSKPRQIRCCPGIATRRPICRANTCLLSTYVLPPHALRCMQAAPAAMAAPAPAAAAAAPAAAPARPAVTHKSTAIIPGWSRHLTSQTLTIECQKITQSNRGAGPRDCYGVMELEVMKFVAYCGGLTIKLRVDDLQHGPVERCVCGCMLVFVSCLGPMHAHAHAHAACGWVHVGTCLGI